MTETASLAAALAELHEALQARGAAQLEPVGWHYISVLSDRAKAQTGPAQKLLNHKLEMALLHLKAKLDAAPSGGASCKTQHLENNGTKPSPAASPLAALLNEMQTETIGAGTNTASAWRAESPRIRQFRKQLSQISVQKQVSHAMAQAPQNAGPINSHMLVLRSLGLMRDASPDYLNRFMGYVDTLLFLEEADVGKRLPSQSRVSGRPKK